MISNTDLPQQPNHSVPQLEETPKGYTFKEILVAVIVLYAIFGMAKLLVQRIEEHFYKEVFIVYACPQKTNSSKCYKVKADYVPGKWINEGNDYEQEWFETIYFGNGGYIAFSSCDLKDKAYTCYPKKESNGVWKLQISEVIKVRKSLARN